MRVEFDDVFNPVDHSSPIPLYLQIVSQIEEAIRYGRLAQGMVLPAEPVLCAEFTVARTTVRRAMGILQKKGTVSRDRGRGGGTRIASTGPINRQPGNLDTIFEIIKASSRKPLTELLIAERLVVDEDFGRESGFEAGAEVIHLVRHRSADDLPIALLENWIRIEAVRFDLERVKNESLDELLRENGVEVERVDFEFRPTYAGSAGEFFNLASDAAVINEIRSVFDWAGQFEFSHHISHPLNERFRGTTFP